MAHSLARPKVTSALAGTSPDERVGQSESRRRRVRSHSSRTDSFQGRRESWACDLHGAGTILSICPHGAVWPVPSHVPRDTPITESAASTRRELVGSRASCLDAQNTADRAQIPGNDGGFPHKVLTETCARPAPQGDQPSSCPSPERRRIGQARRILAMWCSVLDRIAGTHLLTGLLATRQRVLRRWREPVRQDRERPMARSADAPAHPYAVVQFVMSLPESTSVTDNRVVTAHWASPREAFRRN